MSHVIGIDLGTTNSCTAMVIDGVPKVIPTKAGYKVMPSVVAVTPEGKKLIGHTAKRQAITNPENTVFSAKRLIGRSFDSPVVQSFMITSPFKIIKGPNNDPRIQLVDRAYTVPEVQALVLSELRNMAEDFLGEPVNKAVVTVPAYFKDSQRHATMDAGKIAGLEIIRMLNEPTAAALAYGYGKNIDQRVVIYDLGGGTFDISILEIHNGMYEVITSNGDTFLGGEDFDNRILEWLLEQFMDETGIDLREDSMAIQRLKEAAETAKIALSTVTDSEINLPFIANTAANEPLHLKKTLTRSELEGMTADLVERTVDICATAMRDGSLDPTDIDAVLLVGGQTRMPKVQAAVQEFFGCPPSKNINPDEVVALGAAIQGAMLLGDEHHDQQSLLLDLTPHSLGIEISNGLYKEIIPKDSPIPISKSHIFTTERDYQKNVRITVLQGVDRESQEHLLLGEFKLTDIPPAPRGDVKIKVFFDMDADGTLNVSAKEMKSGQEQGIVASSYGYLSQHEIAGMIEFNREHLLEQEEEEERGRVLHEVKNLLEEVSRNMPALDNLITATESVKGQEARQKIRNLLSQAEAALAKGNIDLLGRIEAPLRKAHELIQKMLAQQTRI